MSDYDPIVYDPILEKWLALGADWLNSLLTQGIVHISPATRQKIERWSQYAGTLGFSPQAELAVKIIDGELSADERSRAFYTLLLQQDLYQQLYNAEQLKRDYLPELR